MTHRHANRLTVGVEDVKVRRLPSRLVPRRLLTRFASCSSSPAATHPSSAPPPLGLPQYLELNF